VISKWTVLGILATCTACLAQSPVILDMDLENETNYLYDLFDYTKVGTDPASTTVNGGFKNFAISVAVDDIVAVNGKPAKGVFLFKGFGARLSTTPTPGIIEADVNRFAAYDLYIEILQPDGTPVGTLMATGMFGGPVPPGAPTTLAGASANFTIVGGTGAFLGARGQMVSAPQRTPGTSRRLASVTEDPSRRRQKIGPSYQRWILHVIPMVRPEVVITQTGPSILHTDFSPVTQARPASAGEALILFAKGLGPTRGGTPDEPFPTEPLSVINSPVEVLVNGIATDAINQIGEPGTTDTYRVDFRVPDGIPAGTAKVQLRTAWIEGGAVQVPVR
jgi:hypothetical protein